MQGGGRDPLYNYESHLSTLSCSPHFQTRSDVRWHKEVELCLGAVYTQSTRQPARILKALILTSRSWTNVEGHKEVEFTSPWLRFYFMLLSGRQVFMDDSFELMSYFVFLMTRKWHKVTGVSVIFSFPALCSRKAWMHADDPCVLPGVQRRALGGWMIRRMLLVQLLLFFFFTFFFLHSKRTNILWNTHFKTFYSLSLV